MGDQPEKIDAPPPSHNPQSFALVAQEGFGKNAAAYDASRPGYTDRIVEVVLEEILAPAAAAEYQACLKYDVLELGAGTGKLTQQVSPKLPENFRYLATDPSQNFLDHLKEKSLPIETMNVSAEAIPLPDNSVQNILCGQCLHWFSNEESFKEISRVLVPGGKLIPVWNLKKFEEGKWTMEFNKQLRFVMEQVGSSKVYCVYSGEWRKALDASRLFKCQRHEVLPGTNLQGTLDDVINHFRSLSFYNALPEEDCHQYLDQLKDAVLQYPGVTPDHITFPFTSEIYVFKTARN